MGNPEPKELPLGMLPPPVTPPEGVVISRVEGDGWTRKYHYQAKRTMGDRIVENSLLIAEIPPAPRSSYREVPAEMAPMSVPQVPQVAAPVTQGPALGTLRAPGRVGSNPFSSAMESSSGRRLSGPMVNSPILSTTPPPSQSPRLAQGPGVQAPVTSLPPAGAVAPTCPTPAPLQLPDGRIVQLTDKLKLSELWQILPYLTKQCVSQVKIKPPKTPTGLPGIPTSPINAGFPGFGASTGVFGGGGFPGSGGNVFGPLGQVNPQNPIQPSPLGPSVVQGPAGPAGPQGPQGAGTGLLYVTKVDGDFTAGPGAFVPIPGTLLSFTQGAPGAVLFAINACFGCDNSVNNALALSIDGTIYPLQATLWPTMSSGVLGFLDGSSAMWPIVLPSGAHQAQLMLRGIMAGEFCSGSGQGIPATVSANPNVPLSLALIYQVPGAIPATTPVLVNEGYQKTDGPFAATGALTAVPNASIAFTVTTPGNVMVTVSADFAASPPTILPSIDLGIIFDGGTPLTLATISLENGGGGDNVSALHLEGMIVLPNVPAGPHTVQMAYVSGPVPGIMTLQASPTLPANISILHT